ncbi:hypothetical protein OG426_05090 [Streptomyces canus]|uniref:hypothetical protein n=1 Tax=Streptomyces canus TaxID=58343 RepID=UPI00386C6343|nr:hypothetical protein OG426_05090 [Streptomyces canus]
MAYHDGAGRVVRAPDDGFQACTAVTRQVRTWAPRSASCKAVSLPPFLDTGDDVPEPAVRVHCGTADHDARAVAARAATARLTVPKSMSARSPSSPDPRTSAKT